MKATIYALAALLAAPSATYAARRRAARRLQSSSMSMEMIDAANTNAAIEPNYSTSSKSSKGSPVSDLSPGRYIICAGRSASSFNKFSEGTTESEVQDADYNPGFDVNSLGEGLYSSIYTTTVACFALGIDISDCPNVSNKPVNSTDGNDAADTVVKYYFVGAQSFNPMKKNEVRFKSHYAEYLDNNETYLPIDNLGDNEVATLDIAVLGRKLFGEVEAYFDAQDEKFALSGSFVLAKEEDGCN